MAQDLPQTMGHEAAGVVDELGEGVHDVAVGDRVFGFTAGSTVLINGASGSIGSAAVQFAVARGARVLGTASAANQDYLRSLGAEPTTYGEGPRVRALAPDGVDFALDVAGSGILPELIELAGGPAPVITVADFDGAEKYGVPFSRGDAGRALHALDEIGQLVESGRFVPPAVQAFPLAEVAEAHRVSEEGHVRAKLVLVTGGASYTFGPAPSGAKPL
nr:zinc-binding dehydrogenase [Amycolatopsis panacis]